MRTYSNGRHKKHAFAISALDYNIRTMIIIVVVAIVCLSTDQSESSAVILKLSMRD